LDSARCSGTMMSGNTVLMGDSRGCRGRGTGMIAAVKEGVSHVESDMKVSGQMWRHRLREMGPGWGYGT